VSIDHNLRVRSSPGSHATNIGQLGVAAVLVVVAPAAALPWGLSSYHIVHLLVSWTATCFGVRALARRDSVAVPPGWQAVMIFVACLFISTLIADDPWTTIIGHSDRHQGVIGWLMLLMATVIGANLVVGAVAVVRRSLEAAGRFVAVVVLLQTIFDQTAASGRPGGTFGSATYAGAFLAFVLPFWVDRTIQANSSARVVVAESCGATAIAVALVLTGSRGAWIGAAVSCTWVVLANRQLDWRSVARRLLLPVTVVGAAVLASGVGRDRIETIANPLSGTGSGRIELWRAGWRATWARPLFGWGPDRTRVGLTRSLSSDFERRFADVTIPDRAHNALLDLTLTVGLVGALALVAGVVIAVRARARMTRSLQAPTRHTVWIAALTGHACHLFFNFVQLDVDMVAALALGVWLAPACRRVGVPLAVRTVWSTVATVAVVATLLFAGLLLAADLTAEQAVNAESSGNALVAQQKFQQASDMAFGDARYDEILARFARRQQLHEIAIASADAAAAHHRDDPFLGELAAIVRAEQSVQTGDRALAADAAARYRDLIADWPYHARFHTGLGVAMIGLGDTAAATSAFETAISIAPRSFDPYRNLTQLQLQLGDRSGAAATISAAKASVDDVDAVEAFATAVGLP
jgi:O-antigen ligase/Flp pilus assembly protein TadD